MPVGSAANERFHDDRSSQADRQEYERDRDRILYSDAFRRLKGIAQVASSQEAYSYHTRMTHSLKVGQVGRRLAQYLIREDDAVRPAGGDDTEALSIAPIVVETAALAHDLGHPPFGHPAEDELNTIIQEAPNRVDDGFEGNPQSFRIVSGVETNALYSRKRDDLGRGLNLTKATLNALLKYPWGRGKDISAVEYDTDEKFGYYATEAELFKWVRQDSTPNVRSPEATLMDWADDVTYAVHDVIDFYKAGLIPLHSLLQGTQEREEFINHFEATYGSKIPDAFEPGTFLDSLRKGGLDEPEMKQPYQGTREADGLLDRMRSDLIEDYLLVPDTVEITDPGDAADTRPATEQDVDRSIIDIDPEKQAEVEMLKQMTFHYVIRDRTLASQQQGQRQIVNNLFDAFLAATDEEYNSANLDVTAVNERVVPQPFRDDLLNADNPSDRVRFTADAITVMTEQQARQLYGRITGQQHGSIQENLLR
jgi:dGTPase